MLIQPASTKICSAAVNLPAYRRAQPPRAPEPTPGLRKAQAERREYLEERESLERNSVLRGLTLLALLALVISLVRAGVDRAFYAGWWKQW